MDGVTLYSIGAEIRQLIGARIEKIYQPEKDELYIHLRGGYKLLLSAHPVNCRVQFSDSKRENPDHPPMFCMLLRKHLTGGKLLSAEQPNLDRVLHIGIEARDELGELCRFELVTEIMGRHSNIVLVNQGGVTLGAIKHITPSISSVRIIMPGVTYSPPPPQEKANPLVATRGDVIAALDSPTPRAKSLLGAFSGLSPHLSEEIAASIGQDTPFSSLDAEQKVAAAERVLAYFTRIKEQDFSPTLILDDSGYPIKYLPFDSLIYSPAYQRSYKTMSRALSAYYELRDRAEQLKRNGAALQKLLRNNIERCTKKLSLQQDALLGADKAEKHRLYGDLLTANLYKLKRGMNSIALENYYGNEEPVTIPLDESMTPSENAQRYYKLYNKAKKAAQMAAGQIIESRAELEYLESLEASLQMSSSNEDLAEIRNELTAQGYLRPAKPDKRKAKPVQSEPLHFVSSDGADIYVGKNNKQNDRLTLKTAAPGDTWLHAKEIPGSHVIIKGAAPSDATLKEAAMLAAYYSKAKNSANVPVDYTEARHVKKPSGAKPGMVIYTNQSTLHVTPDEQRLPLHAQPTEPV